MDFIDLYKTRRSVRKFKNKEVEKEKLELCLDAAFHAPSALNSQPWKFYVVKGNKRDELVEIIRRYPIYTADLIDYYPSLSDPDTIEAINDFAENLGNAPVIIVVTTPETSNEHVRKNQLIACGAAIENFYLMATELGLATVCLTSASFVEKEILEYLGVKGEEVVTVLPVGYPDEKPEPPQRENKAVYLADE